MTHALRIAALLALAAMALGGCASLDARPAFDDVRQQVADRTGHQVQWNQGRDEDAAVAVRVKTMLADELSVEQAVQIALLNNRRMQASYEQLGIAQAHLVQAGLLRNPVFGGSFRLLSGGGGTGVLEMQVEQEFLDILLIPMKKHLAESELAQARLHVMADVMDLAYRVRVAFIDLQSSQQAVTVWRTTAEAAEASYDVARRLHQAGNVTDLDLSGQRALYEQAKLDLAAAEADVLTGRERLNALLGLWGDNTTWYAAARLPDVPENELDLDDLEKQAVGHSLDLALARKEIETAAAASGLDVATTVFPNAAVGGQAEHDPGGPWQVGPMLTVPIPLFDFGQAASAAGRDEVRRRWEQYVALAVEVRAAARSARHRLLYARQQALYYRTVIVPLRQQITAETLLQYNAMQLGVFDLLMAKQQEVDAGRRALEALRDYWIARSDMELILKGRTPAAVLDDVAGGMAGSSTPMHQR